MRTDTAASKSTPAAPPASSWHRLRKRIHLLCFLVFLALPFCNVVRFDVPRQRFYFAGYELWISEFGIVFFALMFLMFLVVASSIFYGRIYCGYLCPQMIFSEASLALEDRIRRRISKRFIHWKPKTKQLAVRGTFLTAVAAASVFLAFVFISYFIEPRDLFRRLISLDLKTAGGVSGAVVTLIAFLDFSVVRLRFCTTACPYGYLQGILGDDNTLLVHYRDRGHDCIECKKCVRVCAMGIDIRNSPYQIECVHCGECIDACEEILARVGKPGLIHYAWGEKGESLGGGQRSWYRRIGIRDAKRVVVLLVLCFYASGLFLALSMRRAVLVQVAPDRANTLYRVDAEGRVFNTFRYSVANRGKAPAAVAFTTRGLPGAVLQLPGNPVPVNAGESAHGQFEIFVPPARRSELVNHFEIAAQSSVGRDADVFPMTFLTPTERKTP